VSGGKVPVKDGRELKSEENKTEKNCVFPVNVRKEAEKA